MRLRVEVIARRGPIEESRHRIEFALCDAAGNRVAGGADPGLVTSLRSAAKPFQVIPLVERGHAERWGFGDEELAVMAASHTGSAYHVALVRGILERIGLGPDRLTCGHHEPQDPEARRRLQVRPAARSPLHNNCSGKHAGMLALALAEGWPIEGYALGAHPVQQLMRRVVAEVCGLAPEDLLVGVDGCGVSVFGLPLAAMARGYARLASARADGDARERALARVRHAMLSHPRAAGGAGRLDTSLVERGGGTLLAKGGAEGLECVGLVGPGLGLAVKCVDGRARPLAPAVLALLGRFQALPREALAALEREHHAVLTNHAGSVVGAVEVAIRPVGP